MQKNTDCVLSSMTFNHVTVSRNNSPSPIYQSTIYQNLQRMDAKECKKNRTPQCTGRQKYEAVRFCCRLYQKVAKVSRIIDDSSYFMLSHPTINANTTFYSWNIEYTPARVKLYPKTQFVKKVPVWLAIESNEWCFTLKWWVSSCKQKTTISPRRKTTLLAFRKPNILKTFGFC